MANAFDQFDPAPIAGNPFDQFDKPKKAKSEDTGAIDAFVRSAANAATFGFADRIAAGLGALTGIGGKIGQYDKNFEAQRAIDEVNAQEHPIASIGGSVAGGVALPAKAIAAAPTFLGKVGAGAKIGALQGGLFGAGSSQDLADARDVGANIGQGAALGAGLGAVAPAAGAAARNIFTATGIPQAVRGFMSPENEALRQIGQALESDLATRAGLTARRKAQGEAMGAAERARMGLTPQEAGTALDNAIPVTTADYGGEATRRLARQAANISPEASDILRSETAHRFEGQATRIAERLSVLGGGNSVATLDRLKEAAKRAYKPAYDKAYAEGDKGIWTPELERLSGSPDVLAAMKSAVTTGKSRAINEGYGAFNPGVQVTDDGRVIFKAGEKGVPAYPNLQYWDYVKKDLDEASKAAYKAGRTEEGSRLASQARMLRAELDRVVPSYADARGLYATFGGASDALEAGANFVTSKGANSEYAKTIAKMSDAERKLFAHGFMSEVERQVNEVGANRSPLVKSIFQSPAARERLRMAIGDGKSRQFEHALHVENVMDQLRTAVTGNSTTAQQLSDIVRHGGVLGAGLHMAGLVKAMMQHGARGVDETVMQRVAEGLTSRDPRVYQRALETVRKSSPLSRMFSNADEASIKAALAEYARQKRTGRR